ncbi:caspase family protein [Streptomyces sp. ISL-96]|uniref:HD domain-containing protein n=1 Tax=Streptomyces sp. ISL-96 TaxID=2819191 RepID=UPI001BE6DFC3|nr:caspase family protein [Streptomyces sp. ISL-96]MBT2490127.1 caspase family protein [Streptomyces sp. ISL-96]
MERARTALLIGVGTTPEASEHFESLEEPVAADLRNLAAALRGSGYEVETLPNPTRRDITASLARASGDVPPDGTLLLYFSGHGVRIDDTDYLVPHDASAPVGETGDWQQPHVLESLLPADISRYLTGCSAGTVLWLVDACRSGTEESREAFGSGILKGPPSGRFAVMTGCAARQLSGHTAEGSFFTSGLAEALGPMTNAQTVQEVFEAARAHTTKLAHRHGLAQRATIRYGSDHEPETRTTVVCNGRRLLETWRAAVVGSGLWDRAPQTGAGDLERIREALLGVVDECARTVHRAQERLPDPWADDELPVRLLRDRLPRLIGESVEISAVEAAALLAAPFLHEAAWAGRLSAAPEIHPQALFRWENGGAARRHYEQVAEHRPDISRKLRDARSDDADAVTLWLVHRWIAEQMELDEHPVPLALTRRLAAELLGQGAGEGRAAELAEALAGIAAGVALGEQGLSTTTVRLPGQERAHPLRVRPLAALLRLAGLLALDVRTFPDVLAEHLAVPDRIIPPDVVYVVRHAQWNEDAEQLHLDVICPHPAVHAALAATVEHADELARTLRDTAEKLAPREAELLAAVPTRITGRLLRPAEERGRRVYDVPLLRFQLSQTEVRNLLMGEKLYDGEPELALRELYQNAMDACRYRAMRKRFLESTGRRQRDWTGQIRFVQGEDERGRYVECRDNGVGMGVEQLKNTFTRAGRRFEQSRSFRREQQAWLRHDRSLRLYPNSRFGIGVFSYFMLAKEMAIVTRPVDADGSVASKALLVQISSSGSLFRIQEFDEPGDGMPEGGTRVRLYLRDDIADAGLSCVDTLGNLVLISEFALAAHDAKGAVRTWTAGELWPGSPTVSSVEAVPGVLWWVNGTGAIVCDGIATDKRPDGYVLNLTGAQAGDLSVNRKRLKYYDSAWEAEQWQKGANALAGWPELTMGWLWRLESRNLRAARTVWPVLTGRDLVVRHELESRSRTVRLDAIGCFSLDSGLTKLRPLKPNESHTVPWRASALGMPRLRREEDKHVRPASLAGHPVPEPGWAEVATRVTRDWRDLMLIAYQHDITVSEAMRVARALRLTHPQFSPPASRAGDLDWTPDYQDFAILRGLVGDERQEWEADITLKNGYRHAHDDLGGLVRASAATDSSLGELVDACRRYAPLLAKPLPDVPEQMRDHVCDELDLAALYVREARTWRRAHRYWDSFTNADRQGLSPREVHTRLSRFTWLGWNVPDWETAILWGTLPTEVGATIRHFVFRAADGHLTLPWAATLDYAANEEIPLRKAERDLHHWANRLGLVQRRRYTEKSGSGRLIPSGGTSQFVSVAHSEGIQIEDGITMRDLACAEPRGVNRTDMGDVLDELRAAGVDAPDASALLRSWNELPVPHRYSFSGRDNLWDGSNYPLLPTSEVLFGASLELKQSLAKTWKNARRRAKPFGLNVPELPVSLAGRQYGQAEGAALIDWGYDEESDSEWMEPPHWTPFTPTQLVAYSRRMHTSPRAAYLLLAPLRAIGALVPELSEAEVNALPDQEPSAQDWVAVSGEFRVSAPGEPLGPLDLVSVAGRLGEEVSRTWSRIAPYLPLEPETGLVAVPLPDVLPLWQDLSLLSVHADGQLPARHGRVTADDAAFAAQAVGESESWVVDRLHRYAELFELNLKDLEHHD